MAMNKNLKGLTYMERCVSEDAGTMQVWVIFANPNRIARGDLMIISFFGVWAIYKLRGQADYERIAKDPAGSRKPNRVVPWEQTAVFNQHIEKEFGLTCELLTTAKALYHQRESGNDSPDDTTTTVTE